MTAAQWADAIIESWFDGNGAEPMVGRAMADARAEALEQAARYVEECNTPHHHALAAHIREMSAANAAQPPEEALKELK